MKSKYIAVNNYNDDLCVFDSNNDDWILTLIRMKVTVLILITVTIKNKDRGELMKIIVKMKVVIVQYKEILRPQGLSAIFTFNVIIIITYLSLSNTFSLSSDSMLL